MNSHCLSAPSPQLLHSCPQRSGFLFVLELFTECSTDSQSVPQLVAAFPVHALAFPSMPEPVWKAESGLDQRERFGRQFQSSFEPGHPVCVTLALAVAVSRTARNELGCFAACTRRKSPPCPASISPPWAETQRNRGYFQDTGSSQKAGILNSSVL